MPKSKDCPALIFKRLKEDSVIVLEFTTTSEAEKRILEICGGDKKKKKHYDYIVSTKSSQELEELIGTTIALHTIAKP